MNTESRPLYGELVINTSADEERPEGEQEARDMQEEARRRKVEEAAYYLAQKRGFSPGYEMQDWLAAEAEIDKQEK